MRELVPLALAMIVAACSGRESSTTGGEPEFVTSAECARCHSVQHESWRGSQHDLALQRAGERAVLGDFDGVRFADAGSGTDFFREGDAFMVRTRGPGGERGAYPVAYTIGVHPLQQYLIALPGGRLQALTIAWDARSAREGGQRWFSLHPDERTPPGDVLHWSGAANRWNAMCAHCHSTNLRRGYDLERDLYETTWSEIDVACEACHGPGSLHVAWARAGADPGRPDGLRVRLRDRGTWRMDPATGIASRDPPLTSRSELEVCAPCHSRRSLLGEDAFAGRYLDAHLPALLEAGLYHADGQILDEVYVYGSFLQSRMYGAGVRCSDCHDPHSLALRGDTESICAQCHAPERFAVPAHHHHAGGSPGARCVSCHMPSRTYMQIDDRRDHGFRVPRPDLSVALGTPNACNACHTDRDASWAAEQVMGWSHDRRAGSAHFAHALAAARAGAPDAGAQLIRVARDADQPGIVRATALAELARAPRGAGADLIGRAAADPDPLVRIAASRAAERLPLDARVAPLAPLLSDPLRAVRVEAARALADAPAGELGEGARAALEAGLEEYRAAQRLDADQPAAHANLGLLHLRRGELDEAAAAYRRALRVGPHFVPAYANLADLERLRGRESEAERVLREGLADHPDSADLLHALGLSLVRQGRRSAALEPLARAAGLAPGNARFAQVHALALHEAGRTERALEVLRAAHARHPRDPALLESLVGISLEAGKLEDALGFARALQRAAPDDPRARRLAEQLESELRR